MGYAKGVSQSTTTGRNSLIQRLAYRYNRARATIQAQDAYCEKAMVGILNAQALGDFPEDLQWEALVDVLRGKVKVRFRLFGSLNYISKAIIGPCPLLRGN